MINKKLFKVLLIVSTLSVVAGCGKTDVSKQTEKVTQTVEKTTPSTSAYITDVVEEFEENGEKFYREITATAKMEIIYRKFDKKIISKEEVIGYQPTSVADGGIVSGTQSGSRNLTQIAVYNIYKDEPVKNVELTLYNCSGYFADGRQEFKAPDQIFDCRASCTAKLSSKAMANIWVLYDIYGKKVEELAKLCSVVDKAVIQADITYNDGTTKTEYLSLGSHEGRNCNYLTLYRLEVEE